MGGTTKIDPVSALRAHQPLAAVAATCALVGAVTASAAPIQEAAIWTKVAVAAGMQSAPFDTARFLKIPRKFSAAVYARVPGARFMALTPNGDLLVSQPGKGSISLVRERAGTAEVSTFASGLRAPHDMVFHRIGATTYLYLAESHQIGRYVYTPGDLVAKGREIVVNGLPDSSTPELKGQYGHELKNIALGPDHKLYVSIASTCNVCLSDTASEPVRGAIYQYPPSGGAGRLFARGLRNAEGLAFVPGTDRLWVVVNNRDNTPYPHPEPPGLQGRVIPDYVDNHPPEEFTEVRDGGNYGWPFCNPNPDTRRGLKRMPFDRDYDMNADGHVDCSAMDRISQALPAHSAPLGLTFLMGTRFDRRFRNGVAIALHGSWNRQRKSGYEVAYFPWNNAANRPLRRLSLVSGWLDENTQTAWGRPVDVAVDANGNLLVSDDQSGTIYKFSKPR